MLAAAAREIGAGRLDQRVEPQSNDEFGSLVEAFNSMAGELATSRRKVERSTFELERIPISKAFETQRDEFSVAREKAVLVSVALPDRPWLSADPCDEIRSTVHGLTRLPDEIQ
jgi:methyl-accepting chemotaxis protein